MDATQDTDAVNAASTYVRDDPSTRTTDTSFGDPTSATTMPFAGTSGTAIATLDTTSGEQGQSTGETGTGGTTAGTGGTTAGTGDTTTGTALYDCDTTQVLCLAAPPSCAVGQRPSVVERCWGECVDDSRCAS